MTSRPDRLTGALEILIRTAALERDLHAYLPRQTFWQPPLSEIDGVARDLIEATYRASPQEWPARERGYANRSADQFSHLTEALTAYGESAHLDGVASRGPALGYEVDIQVGAEAAGQVYAVH